MLIACHCLANTVLVVNYLLGLLKVHGGEDMFAARAPQLLKFNSKSQSDQDTVTTVSIEHRGNSDCQEEEEEETIMLQPTNNK